MVCAGSHSSELVAKSSQMRQPRNKVIMVVVKCLTEGPSWRVELLEHFKQKSDIIKFLFYKLTLDALKITEGYEMRKRNQLRECFWNPRDGQCGLQKGESGKKYFKDGANRILSMG